MTLTLERAPSNGAITLHLMTPSQQRAFDKAMATIPGSPVTLIKGEVGCGKSLLVAHLQAQLGGTIYKLDDLMAEVVRRDAGKIEETLVEHVVSAFKRDDVIFLEDMTMFDVLGAPQFVDRPDYLPHVMAALYEKIMDAGMKLIVASSNPVSSNHASKAAIIEMDGLRAADYMTLIRNRSGSPAEGFDINKVARTYLRLTGHQVAAAMNMLRRDGIVAPDADQFLAVTDRIKARTNFAIEDVEDVSLDGLVGLEAVQRELMRTIVIPMTQPELARELGLKPARGVLLHGEPGTGKTTIGRALARQMKGKFFSMDGTVAAADADKMLRAAEASSPSVLFIDDADVLLRHSQHSAFARKLLTKLDGMESESIGNVCIIMTAMDLADMPPAIIRSGRVEVWIEMEVPDAKKRADIIRHYARSLPEHLRDFDEQILIDATAGYVPADLRGLVSDARGHIAYDRHNGRPERSFEDYLLIAAQDIWDRKMVIAGLAGKPQKMPKLPQRLAPPPCTSGLCD